MKKVYVIGDSISIQYGPYLEKALRGWMEYGRKEGEEEALLNLDRPQGANGGDSAMVLDFLQAKERAGGIAADLLLLNCGLHDIKTHPATGEKQVPLARYRENLETIVALAARLGPALVWMRTTPCDERVHNSRPDIAFHRFAADCAAYNRAADQAMAAHGVPIIDLHTFTANLGGDLYCDHVHFHEQVRSQQAAYLAGWLAAWLGLEKRR
ncbi:MAG: SGNH/GDSL hydrolase family protein [Candidatus Handelsmanbacteria bacterium]|nr:SGNH/GDSL hydrolase family protein [Candidatus Handelsmanbacteria bacterium]